MSLFVEMLKNPLLLDLLIPAPIFLVGLGLHIYRKIRFKIPNGYVAVAQRKSRVYSEGLHWGFAPDAQVISLSSATIDVPSQPDQSVQMDTPDGGVIGVRVSVSFMPDKSDAKSLLAYNHHQDIPNILEKRVRSALREWIWQKPLPGTLKRALASKADAESAVLSKLTSLPSDALVRFSDTGFASRYAVDDLGIVIREVHITDMFELRRGTGKASWGDDDDLTFNAEKVRLRIRKKVSSVSDLRREREALDREFPEEKEYIEKLIEDERIRSMEHRDR